MAALIFICPATDLSVQYWLDEGEDIPDNEYEVVTCPACTKVHLINRTSGKPLAKSEIQRNPLH